MTEWAQLKPAVKVAEAASVPFPDSSVDTASAAPIPGLAVGNKPAPGQTGPKGMAPRTSYSRVNNGSPIVPDAGTSAQKSSPPDPQGFLPPKIAHSEVSMSAAHPRVTLQSMIKAAASGVADRAVVNLEAARQLADEPPAEKTASAAGNSNLESIPTDYVEKLASAVEFVLEHSQIDEEVQPTKTATIGEGPNHLKVLEAPGGKNTVAPGQQGAASPSHQVPKTTPNVNPGNQPAGPATALETNKPVAGKQKVSAAQPQFTAPIAALRKLASGEKVVATPAVDTRLVDYMLNATKVAEDAINPAHISAGSADSTMLTRSAAGEAGGAPAGGQPQGPTGLVGSNDAARNYTKGEAKAQVKGQLSKVLSEPALSSAHDNVLQKTLTHTGQAGVKISADTKAAAARAVIEKMAEEAAEEDKSKGKKKESMGGSTFSAPPVGGAAGAGM
jgi:hypothetical protein